MMTATLMVGGTVVDGSRVEERDLVLIRDRVQDASSSFPTTATVDCSGCLIVPGFVVGHTHLYSGLAAGMPAHAVPPTTFRQILERVWWRLDQALDESTLRAAVRVAGIAAVRAGATTLVDHHESPNFIDGSLDVIADELRTIGLRAILTYGATDRHGAEGARAGLDESERFVRSTKSDPMVRGAIGLHAPFTCSDETLGSAADRARLNDAWLHYHAAEGPDDQNAARERWGTRLFPKLDTFGLLNAKTIVAHAVDINADEAALIRSKGTWVTHQARSNMNNAVGYARMHVDLEHVAIGTDGIDNDLIAEIRSAFFRRREHSGPAEWPDVPAMLGRSAAMAGAVFEEPTLGTFEVGAPGDVVVLDYAGGTPVDADSWGAHLLFGLSSRYVRDVFVGGRAVMRNRKLVGVDERQMMAEAKEAARVLWSKMEQF